MDWAAAAASAETRHSRRRSGASRANADVRGGAGRRRPQWERSRRQCAVCALYIMRHSRRRWAVRGDIVRGRLRRLRHFRPCKGRRISKQCLNKMQQGASSFGRGVASGRARGASRCGRVLASCIERAGVEGAVSRSRDVADADDVWNLRTRRCFTALARAFWGGGNRFGFRLVHYSVQGNHVHLLVEAKDEKSLSRGMCGLGVRVARGLNRVMRRRGRCSRIAITGTFCGRRRR